MKHFHRPFIDIDICLFDIIAYILQIFMFCVYMFKPALYILFAPGSYTSHWLIFVVVVLNMTGNKPYIILYRIYLILFQAGPGARSVGKFPCGLCDPTVTSLKS